LKWRKGGSLAGFYTLGLILSLAIGVEYNCEGQEMFPIYYGSPVVFKQKSLGSSMEYFYSISGLIINVLVWSFLLYFFDKFIHSLIRKISKPKLIRIPYKTIIALMIVFTILNIVIDSAMIGRWGYHESVGGGTMNRYLQSSTPGFF
jgi:hypothetical protein